MKTLTHRLRDLGISVDYNSIYMPGKRGRKTLSKKRIAEHHADLAEIAKNVGHPVLWPFNNWKPISDIKKFTKLMHRMPTPDDHLHYYKTFELWFALVYNDEENKPLEESVFYSESKAHKLFNSL